MEKIIVFNLWSKIENISKFIEKAVIANSYLFGDMTFYFSPLNSYLSTFRAHTNEIDNVFIVSQDTHRYYDKNKGFNNKPINNNKAKSIAQEMKKNPDGAIVSNYMASPFNTSYETPARNMFNLHKAGKKIIYTVGETFDSFSKNLSSKYLIEKLDVDLSQLPRDIIKNLIIVYYPPFTYNKDVTPNNEHIDDMVQLIRSFVNSRFGQQCPILYGGNVNKDNILSFCVSNNLDGFMIDITDEDILPIIDITRKVHGWQRIISNQIQRRK